MISNILCCLQTILQRFPPVFFVLESSIVPFQVSLCALWPAHPCCRSKLWLMELKMDIKSSVPFRLFLPDFLCDSSFKFENWSLFLLDFQSIELVKMSVVHSPQS